MRLFAAVYPTGAVQQHLVDALRDVRSGMGTALRWGDPDQWHITLSFYGEQPRGAIPEIVEHLESAARDAPVFAACLRGAGSFSGTTLWLGVGGETAALTALMRACALDPDRPSARPHLTVARLSRAERGRRAREQRRRSRVVAREEPELAHVVHALSVYEGPAWHVGEVRLMASRPGEGRSGGALHEELHRIPLAAR